MNQPLLFKRLSINQSINQSTINHLYTQCGTWTPNSEIKGHRFHWEPARHPHCFHVGILFSSIFLWFAYNFHRFFNVYVILLYAFRLTCHSYIFIATNFSNHNFTPYLICCPMNIVWFTYRTSILDFEVVFSFCFYKWFWSK